MMIPLLLLVTTCISSIFLLHRFHFSFLNLSWGWSIIILCMKQSPIKSKPQISNADKSHKTKLLDDLPEPILDIILDRLPSDGLCRMTAVSTFLRKRCISDHLWDRHMKLKWGRIIGPAAYQEWQRRVMAIRNDPTIPFKGKKGLTHCLIRKLYKSPHGTRITHSARLGSTLPVDSICSMYLALENGTFWFPAQIYNRQNGHVGFLLSCYDAKLCYDHQTDTFQARYPAHGMLDVPIEKNVTWDRLRRSPVNNPPYDLYHTDPLTILSPGDDIEIQWRRNEDLPYGWWYGVVGHLDSCDGNEYNCQCTTSDKLIVEFKQYCADSRWRKILINMRDHIEKGNEDIGFYGGIRKLESLEELSKWHRLWRDQLLGGV